MNSSPDSPSTPPRPDPDGTESEPIDDLPPVDSVEADELASYADGAFTRWIFRED